MELHPVLECGEPAKTGLWYVISSPNPPTARVGQACVYFGPEEIENGSEYALTVVGGANPSSEFQDTHCLDLTSFKWSCTTSKELEPRYEHCAFVPTSKPNQLFVFGGANKTTNLNSVQVFNKDTKIWENITTTGTVPTPRTLHSAASQGDLLYVWGGGHQGATPIPDVKLHVFDATKHTWSQPNITGSIPCARHGHVLIAVNQFLFIHGGMSGTTFHKDMYSIDLTNTNNFSYTKLKPKGDIPCARAAHAACCYGNMLFMFGGMSQFGAQDDMYSFNTVTHTWSLMKFDSPPPTPRLDHSMVCVMLPVFKRNDNQETTEQVHVTVEENLSPRAGGEPKVIPVDMWQGNVDGDSTTVATMGEQATGDGPVQDQPEVDETIVERKILSHTAACLVFGGMDTSGNIFNDIVITVVGKDS